MKISWIYLQKALKKEIFIQRALNKCQLSSAASLLLRALDGRKVKLLPCLYDHGAQYSGRHMDGVWIFAEFLTQ